MPKCLTGSKWLFKCIMCHTEANVVGTRNCLPDFQIELYIDKLSLLTK